MAPEEAPFLLLRLPLEIQRATCADLCEHCAYAECMFTLPVFHDMQRCFVYTRELSSLSKSCRALRDLAQPILHHVVPVHRPAKFLRTLLGRPDLAASVRVYAGLQHMYSYDGDRTPCISYAHRSKDAREAAGICASVGQALDVAEPRDLGIDSFLGQPFEGSWIERSAQVAQLDNLITSSVLALCPNLRIARLYISTSTFETIKSPTSQYMQPRIEKTGSIGVHGNTFPALGTLPMDWPCRLTSKSLGLERISLLLDAMPNLQRLLLINAQGQLENSCNAVGKLSWPGISKLRQLYFLGHRTSRTLPVPYDAIQRVVEQTPEMETFVFLALSYVDAWITPNPFSPARLLRSLLAAKSTIRDISIATSYIFLEPNATKVTIGPLLREFSNLTSLSLDEQCFCLHCLDGKKHDPATCLVDTLPVTVCGLTVKLHDRYRAVQDVIRLGHDAAMGIFPKLQTLKVEFPYEAWNKREDYSLQSAPTRCLLDCFYCDGDDDVEKLQALVGESRPLILAAFRDTDGTRSSCPWHFSLSL